MADRRGRGSLRAAGALFLIFLAPAAGLAQAPSWQQAETRHFLFIFEPRDRPAVDELLTYCEDIYAEVTSFFQSYPPKVPVILRGRVDQANGFTTSFPRRIELYLTVPGDDLIGSRTENWLKLLLTHELTHFVHDSQFPFFGPWAAIRKVTGKSAAAVFDDVRGFQDVYVADYAKLQADSAPLADPAAPDGARTGVSDLDYQIPIALLDQPLLFGWAITALGMAVHGEGLAQVDPQNGSFVVDRNLYIGGDVTIELVCGYFDFPLGIGLAARVDTRSPGLFDPMADLGLYFFIGYDSFTALFQSGPSPRVRAER